MTELKLGNFDLGSTYFRSADRAANANDLEAQSQCSALTHWHSSQRAALQRSSLGQTSLVKGSLVREFHNAVFDALATPQRYMAFGVFGWGMTRKADTVYAGSGARLYDIVGTMLPQSLVGWMMDNRHRVGKPRALAEGVKVDDRWSANSTAGSESGVWEKV